MKRRIPIEFLERASRIYSNCKDAARALGISEQHYARLCRKHAIETPYRRKQRLKREAKRLDGPKLSAARQEIIERMACPGLEPGEETPEEALDAIDQFEARCRARVEAL